MCFPLLGKLIMASFCRWKIIRAITRDIEHVEHHSGSDDDGAKISKIAKC